MSLQCNMDFIISISNMINVSFSVTYQIKGCCDHQNIHVDTVYRIF